MHLPSKARLKTWFVYFLHARVAFNEQASSQASSQERLFLVNCAIFSYPLIFLYFCPVQANDLPQT